MQNFPGATTFRQTVEKASAESSAGSTSVEKGFLGPKLSREGKRSFLGRLGLGV